jgi:hypothetical protein
MVQTMQTEKPAKRRHQDGAEGQPEERVQRERIVGGEERTGGRMPRETQDAVINA